MALRFIYKCTPNIYRYVISMITHINSNRECLVALAAEGSSVSVVGELVLIGSTFDGMFASVVQFE